MANKGPRDSVHGGNFIYACSIYEEGGMGSKEGRGNGGGGIKSFRDLCK